jgi:hypothetical protein
LNRKIYFRVLFVSRRDLFDSIARELFEIGDVLLGFVIFVGVNEDDFLTRSDH